MANLTFSTPQNTPKKKPYKKKYHILTFFVLSCDNNALPIRCQLKVNLNTCQCFVIAKRKSGRIIRKVKWFSEPSDLFPDFEWSFESWFVAKFCRKCRRQFRFVIHLRLLKWFRAIQNRPFNCIFLTVFPCYSLVNLRQSEFCFDVKLWNQPTLTSGNHLHGWVSPIDWYLPDFCDLHNLVNLIQF